MKGIVFTEFMEMVEQKWSIDMVDDLIDEVDPESGGAYTSVGTYDYNELVAYVVALNVKTDIPVAQLIHAFGKFLAGSFVAKFPDFFTSSSGTFDVLKKVDNHIHVEVRKLYPDAELPKFSHEELADNQLLLRYESTRGLADLAHGLIEGCAEYFGEHIQVARVGSKEGDLSIEEFTLSL